MQIFQQQNLFPNRYIIKPNLVKSKVFKSAKNTNCHTEASDNNNQDDLNEEFNSDEYLSVDKCIYHCTTLQMDTIQIYYKDIDINEYVINIYESQTFEVSRLEYRNNIAQFDYNFRLSEEFKSDVNNIMNIIRYTPRRLFSYHL